MRLTATDKAIGELNMRKADLERIGKYIESGAGVADILRDCADIDRSIAVLRSVQPAPKPEKPARVSKSKKRSRANGAEAEA